MNDQDNEGGSNTKARAQNWVFTWNNYPANYQEVLNLNTFHPSLTYMIYGKEIAPSSGTPHLQGYLQMKSRTTFLTLKKCFKSNGVHIEPARGTPQSNYDYCSKAGDITEIGTITHSDQGKRQDLDDYRLAIENGATEVDLAREFFGVWARYPGLHKRYKQLINTPKLNIRDRSRYNINEFNWNFLDERVLGGSVIIWGEAGFGKTELAKTLLKDRFLWVTHMDDLKKFEPGTHTGILFDDMDFRHLHREAQIHILDYDNDRSIHCRYDTALIPAGTRKVFTTNKDSGGIFDLLDPAIKRRVWVFKLSNKAF